VRSVLGDAGRVESYGNQLIVNAPAGRIEEVRQLLGELDTAPRRLLISVETRRGAGASEQGLGLSGNGVRIIRNSTEQAGEGVQRVQASEGYPALIQLGQSVPLEVTRQDIYGRPYQDTEYRDLSRGFYATAQVRGNNVDVTISTQQDRQGRQPGVVETQGAQTRISGPIGQWLELGGANQGQAADSSGLVHRYSTSSDEDLSLRLKVELLE